jgi:hypothetical protein
MATATAVGSRILAGSDIALGRERTSDALDKTQFLLRVTAAVGELTPEQTKGIIKRACLEAGEVWLNLRVENIERLQNIVEKTPRLFVKLPAVRHKIEHSKEVLEYERRDFKDKLDGKKDTPAYNKITDGAECRFDKKEGKYIFVKMTEGTRMPDTDANHPAGHFEKGTSNFCYYYAPWYDKQEQARTFANLR